MLGASVPCPADVYVVALKKARCPECGDHKGLQAYSPGLTPEQARGEGGFKVRL